MKRVFFFNIRVVSHRKYSSLLAATISRNLKYYSSRNGDKRYISPDFSDRPSSIRALCSLSLSSYHAAADDFLNSLVDQLGPLEDTIEDIDVNLSVPKEF